MRIRGYEKVRAVTVYWRRVVSCVGFRFQYFFPSPSSLPVFPLTLQSCFDFEPLTIFSFHLASSLSKFWNLASNVIGVISYLRLQVRVLLPLARVYYLALRNGTWKSDRLKHMWEEAKKLQLIEKKKRKRRSFYSSIGFFFKIETSASSETWPILGFFCWMPGVLLIFEYVLSYNGLFCIFGIGFFSRQIKIFSWVIGFMLMLLLVFSLLLLLQQALFSLFVC